MNASRDGHDPTADLLRQALSEEAAMVQTDPGALQEIQARTARRTTAKPRRRWTVGVLGAGLATAATITAVVLLTDFSSSPSRVAPARTPDSAPMQEQATLVVTVTYVGPASDDYRLFTEHHDLGPSVGVKPAVAAVRSQLTDGPTDPDYRSGWPAGLDVSDVTRSDTHLQVDLTGPDDALQTDPAGGPKAAEMALQALFRTAGGRVGDTATLTFNGTRVDSALGADLPVKVASDDATRALLAVDITDGQPLDNPVTISVTGNVFEGNVNWQLLDSAGTKVDQGYATTAMGRWRSANVKLGTLEPGTYTFKAIEFSMEDGSVASIDDKTFTVE